MSKLARSIRSVVKSSTQFPAVVTDVSNGRATVKLSKNGATYRSLPVVGGPVVSGQSVMVDFTTPTPTIVAPGTQSNLSSIQDEISRGRRVRKASIGTKTTNEGKGGSFILYDNLGHNFRESVNTFEKIAPTGAATNASVRNYTTDDANTQYGRNAANQFVYSHSRYGSYPTGGFKFTRYNYLSGTDESVQTEALSDQGSIIGFAMETADRMIAIEAWTGSDDTIRIWSIDFSSLYVYSLATKNISGSFLTGEFANLQDIFYSGTAVVPADGESKSLNLLLSFQIKNDADAFGRRFYYFRYMTFDVHSATFSSVFGESGRTDPDTPSGGSGCRVIFTDLGDGYLVGAFSAGRTIYWLDQLEQNVFDEALIINVLTSTVIHKRLPYFRLVDVQQEDGTYPTTVDDYQNSINDGANEIPGAVLAPDYENRCFYITSVETVYLNDPNATYTFRDRIVRLDLAGGMLTTWHEGPPTIYETGAEETSSIPMNCGGVSNKSRPIVVQKRTHQVPGLSPTTYVHFRDCRTNYSILSLTLSAGEDLVPCQNGDDGKNGFFVARKTGSAGDYLVSLSRYLFDLSVNPITGSVFTMFEDIPYVSTYVPIVTIAGETAVINGRSTYGSNETLSVIYRTDYDPIASEATTTTVTGSSSVNVQQIGGSVHVTINPSGVRLDQWASPLDISDLNATTGSHGLLPKLSGLADQFLNGVGEWEEIVSGSNHLIARVSTSGDPPEFYPCTEAGLLGAITDLVDGDIIYVPQRVNVTSSVIFPALNFSIISVNARQLSNYYDVGLVTFSGETTISGSNMNDHVITFDAVNFIISGSQGTNILLDITGGATTYLSFYNCVLKSQDNPAYTFQERYNRNIYLPSDKNGYLQIFASGCYIYSTVHQIYTQPSGPWVFYGGYVVDDDALGNAWGVFENCKLGKFNSDGYEYDLVGCLTLNGDDLQNWKTMATVDIWGTYSSWYTSGKRGSWEDDPGTLDSRHAEDIQEMNLGTATGGKRHLPRKNAVTGDFVRYNGTTGCWEIATEPLHLNGLVLTPTTEPLENVEGSVYYNSSAKALMVCTDE